MIPPWPSLMYPGFMAVRVVDWKQDKRLLPKSNGPFKVLNES